MSSAMLPDARSVPHTAPFVQPRAAGVPPALPDVAPHGADGVGLLIQRAGEATWDCSVQVNAARVANRLPGAYSCFVG